MINKSRPKSFHERFDIELDIEDVKVHFMNSVRNYYFEVIRDWETPNKIICLKIANKLGVKIESKPFVDLPLNYRVFIESYITDNPDDFYNCLKAIEATYAAISQHEKEALNQIIYDILDESEIDLGITWKDGMFLRTGATELDQNLVNNPLEWLSDSRYKDVYTPFKRGLNHFVRAEKYPDLLPDVIKNVYEALEALSKIVTERYNKDLSANAELFIKKIDASEAYKRILKEYIDYANKIRHAPRKGRKKPELSINEVESFVYLTGLFIRLAIK